MDVAKRKFEKVLCLPGMVGRVTAEPETFPSGIETLKHEGILYSRMRG